MFYFINTRKTYEYKVNEESIKLISLINGERTVDDLTDIYNNTYKRNVNPESVMQILPNCNNKLNTRRTFMQ